MRGDDRQVLDVLGGQRGQVELAVRQVDALVGRQFLAAFARVGDFHARHRSLRRRITPPMRPSSNQTRSPLAHLARAPRAACTRWSPRPCRVDRDLRPPRAPAHLAPGAECRLGAIARHRRLSEGRAPGYRGAWRRGDSAASGCPMSGKPFARTRPARRRVADAMHRQAAHSGTGVGQVDAVSGSNCASHAASTPTCCVAPSTTEVEPASRRPTRAGDVTKPNSSRVGLSLSTAGPDSTGPVRSFGPTEVHQDAHRPPRLARRVADAFGHGDPLRRAVVRTVDARDVHADRRPDSRPASPRTRLRRARSP